MYLTQSYPTFLKAPLHMKGNPPLGNQAIDTINNLLQWDLQSKVPLWELTFVKRNSLQAAKSTWWQMNTRIRHHLQHLLNIYFPPIPSLVWSFPDLNARWVSSLPPRKFPRIQTLGTVHCPVICSKKPWMEGPSAFDWAGEWWFGDAQIRVVQRVVWCWYSRDNRIWTKSRPERCERHI